MQTVLTVSCRWLISAAGACVVLAACDESVRPEFHVVFINTLANDTVDAAPRPLIVEVPGAGAGITVNFAAEPVGVGQSPFARFGGDSAGFYTTTFSDTTDTSGRLTVWIRPGAVASTAGVLASVDSGVPTRAEFTLGAGNAARIILTPADTALYVGRTYAMAASVADRFGNPRSDAVAYATDSSAIGLTASGVVTTSAIGRAAIVATAGAFVNTAWISVVPPGRIAAYRPYLGGDTSAIVLVNLDGSARREFPLPVLTEPMPTWHPGGAFLTYSGPVPNGSTARVVELDTATGQLRSLVAAPGTSAEQHPRYSPDGAWVYFTTGRIHRVSTTTGAVELVGYDADAGVSFGSPSPSPTGDSIAVTLGASGSFVLVLSSTTALGSPPPPLVLNAGLPAGRFPRWSPIDSRILVEGDEGLSILSPGAPRLVIAQSFATPQHQTGGFSGASWSPDGQWIVARASTKLLLINPVTGMTLPLPFGSQFNQPVWRPTN